MVSLHRMPQPLQHHKLGGVPLLRWRRFSRSDRTPGKAKRRLRLGAGLLSGTCCSKQASPAAFFGANEGGLNGLLLSFRLLAYILEALCLPGSN